MTTSLTMARWLVLLGTIFLVIVQFYLSRAEDDERKQDINKLQNEIQKLQNQNKGMEERILQAVAEKKITKEEAERILKKDISDTLQLDENVELKLHPSGESPSEGNKK